MNILCYVCLICTWYSCNWYEHIMLCSWYALGNPSKKKICQTLDIVQTSLTSPPIRGGLDSKSLDIMKLSWPPHPLEKFGHLGNKSLAFKKAFILLRQKTVCLYRQVELLVYTSTLHFRTSCENVTMNHFF